MQLIVHTFGIKNILEGHMRSEGASSVGKETSLSEEATEMFSIALSEDCKTTDARISRSKLKERVKISSAESMTEKAREKAQYTKQTASRTTPAAADSNTIAELVLAQTLAEAGVVNDAGQVSAVTAAVGLEYVLNPTTLRLRQFAQQPKYNGNRIRWPLFP